jgi:ribosomal protein L37AE/L43A
MTPCAVQIPFCPVCGMKDNVECFDEYQWYCDRCKVLFQFRTPEDDIDEG